MSNDFKHFLNLHSDLLEEDIKWRGHLYIPPCQCPTTLLCVECDSIESFNFSTYENIDIKQLTDICKYTDTNITSRIDKSLYLCKKYSLASIQDTLPPVSNLKSRIHSIKSTEVVSNKSEIDQKRLEVALPTFWSIICYQKTNHCYSNQISSYV